MTVAGFIFINFVSVYESVAQNEPPPLQELIRGALQKDYKLANQKLDVEKTKVELQQLKETYLPKVDVNVKEAFLLSSIRVNSSEINIPQLNIDIKQGSNTYTTASSLTNANVGANMLLYSGGKIEQLRKAATSKANAQTFMMEKSREDIIGDVIQVYDQLALLKQVKLVLDQSAVRLSENKKTADKAFGYGLITKYDRQKIEVAQAQLASQIEDYEGKTELILEQLFLLTDIDQNRLNLLVNALQPILVSPISDFNNRAELKALDAAIQANHYKIQAEKTWFVPKVQAATSLGYIGLLAGHISSSDPLLPGGNKLSSSSMPNLNILPTFNIGVGLKWDVLDGKTGKRAVQKAAIDLQQTENDKKETVEKLELNLIKCRTDYNTSIGKIKLSEAQLQTALNALTQATGEFRTGLIKSSQLIEAINDYQQAQLYSAQAVYDQRRAAIALLKATGDLQEGTIQ